MEEQNERRSFLRYLFLFSAFTAGLVISTNQGKLLINEKTDSAKTTSSLKVNKIVVEEHFYSKEYSELLQPKADWKGSSPAAAAAEVIEYGGGLVKERDECGIDMQINAERLFKL